MTRRKATHLNSPNIGILSSVLILIKSIFGKLTLLKIDAELDEKYHHKLKGRNRTISRSFGRDMFI